MGQQNTDTDIDNLLSQGKPHQKFKYCIDTCSFNGKESGEAGDMIHCYVCSKWFHEKCVKYDSDLMKGSLFSCPSCCHMPVLTYTIFSQLLSMSSCYKDMQKNIKHLSKELANVNDQLTEVQKETTSLKNENAMLREELAKKHNQTKAQNWSQFRERGKNLLVGDTTIQNILPENLVRTETKVLKAGKMKDFKSELLSRLEADEVETYKEIFISAGANDSTADISVTDCLKDAKVTLECSKSLAEKVTMSSICPRLLSERDERIDGLNAGLSALCEELDVTFVNNDDTFYLNNGTVNEGYLHSDGKSLNGYGINRLPVRHDVTDVTRRGLTHLKSRKNVPMSSPMAPPLVKNAHLGQRRNQRQYEGDTV